VVVAFLEEIEELQTVKEETWKPEDFEPLQDSEPVILRINKITRNGIMRI
jgi:hypothetical protein